MRAGFDLCRAMLQYLLDDEAFIATRASRKATPRTIIPDPKTNFAVFIILQIRRNR
jgi:hypothetical protein